MLTAKKLETAELLYNCAEEMGLEPRWIRTGSLFAVSTPAGERFMYHSKGTLNSQLSCNLTRNKRTTRLVLEHCGLPSIPYLKTADRTEAAQFLATHSKIIVKPVTGSNSHDVRIVDSPEQLVGLQLQRYILEKYIDGKEVRYLILNGEVIGVHESEYGKSVSETRELQRISYPEAEWDPRLITTSLKTAAALDLRYAAVDYLIDSSGQAHILEVNSSPGMKWFHAPTSGPKIDVARMFIEAMLDEQVASSKTVAYS